MKLAASIHRTEVNESNGDSDEDIAIGTGGVGERGRSTIDSPYEIAVRTRINTDLDVADASKLDFFYWLFTPEMFCYNSWANKPVCSHEARGHTKPALQEVNNRPCCAQQRVKVAMMVLLVTESTSTIVVVTFSSSAFDVMVALTRSSLPWVLHTWMSGTNPLQTPRAWFWGTHKWAISAALHSGRVSRTAGNVLVFGPPLHRGIEPQSLHQSSWDGYSVCSGLFRGERWWPVGVMAADGVCPGLGCILQSCSGRWLFFYIADKSFGGDCFRY